MDLIELINIDVVAPWKLSSIIWNICGPGIGSFSLYEAILIAENIVYIRPITLITKLFTVAELGWYLKYKNFIREVEGIHMNVLNARLGSEYGSSKSLNWLHLWHQYPLLLTWITLIPEWISAGSDYLPLLGLKLNHISNRGPRWHSCVPISWQHVLNKWQLSSSEKKLWHFNILPI